MKLWDPVKICQQVREQEKGKVHIVGIVQTMNLIWNCKALKCLPVSCSAHPIGFGYLLYRTCESQKKVLRLTPKTAGAGGLVTWDFGHISHIAFIGITIPTYRNARESSRRRLAIKGSVSEYCKSCCKLYGLAWLTSDTHAYSCYEMTTSSNQKIINHNTESQHASLFE